MAASTFIIFVFLSLFIQQTSGNVICEKLPTDVCAFSIDSSGKRCLLETYNRNSDNPDSFYSYKCMTSEVKVEIKMSDYVETEECVRACGVDRNWVGISSDALLDTQFTAMLCSSSCYQNCPNIVDLYSNLAAGEGVFLLDICESERSSSHVGKEQLLRSGTDFVN